VSIVQANHWHSEEWGSLLNCNNKPLWSLGCGLSNVSMKSWKPLVRGLSGNCLLGDSLSKLQQQTKWPEQCCPEVLEVCTSDSNSKLLWSVGGCPSSLHIHQPRLQLWCVTNDTTWWILKAYYYADFEANQRAKVGKVGKGRIRQIMIMEAGKRQRQIMLLQVMNFEDAQIRMVHWLKFELSNFGLNLFLWAPNLVIVSVILECMH
jgi:hypothetical protein